MVKLSTLGTGEQTSTVGNWHLPGEQELRSGAAEWTVLRPSAFASNVLNWAPKVRAGQPIPNPNGNGTQGVVDPQDIAEVAVRALTSDAHVGQVLTLTGPELLSVPDVAARLGELLGRTIATVDVPLDAYRQGLLNTRPGTVRGNQQGMRRRQRALSARLGKSLPARPIYPFP